MYKLNSDQIGEIKRCAADFSYFCRRYVKLFSYQGNSNSFNLYDYQLRLCDYVNDNRFVIFSKFRQGGFTTVLAVYCLWKCLFSMNQRIVWVSVNNRMAECVSRDIVKHVLENLPDWMTGNVMKMSNVSQKSFPDTNSNLFFGDISNVSNFSIGMLVLDEASFMNEVEDFWESVWSSLSMGGRAIVTSTLNKEGDWFWWMLMNARAGLNNFRVYDCNYRENPEFCTVEWEVKMKSMLGCRWNSEYDQKIVSFDVEKDEKDEDVKKESVWRSLYDGE